jgi:signal transduction histidine kinase
MFLTYFYFMLKRKVLLLFCFLCICMYCNAQAKMDTLVFDVNNIKDLAENYTFYEDCENKSESNILAKFNANEFKKPLNKGAFNTGITQCKYWLAVVIKNNSNKDLPLLWSFYNNGIKFNFYDINNNGGLHFIDSNSMHIPLKKRNFPVRSISFKFTLKPFETKTVFAKVETTTNNAIYFPQDITTPEDYLVYELTFSYLIGKYIGFFMLAFLINIFLWIALKNKIHLFHALYILMITLFSFSDFHFDSFEMTGNIFIKWSYINKLCFSMFGMFFFIKVFQIFVNQAAEHKKIFKIFNIYNYLLIGISSLILILSLLGLYQHPAYKLIEKCSFVYTLLGYTLIIAALAHGLFLKKYYYLLYLISSGLLLAGFLSFILNTLKIVHLFYFPPGNIINGLAFEIAILTSFFVYKYKKEKEEHQQKIEEIIKVKEDLSKSLLDVQEKERKRIAEDLHDGVGSTLISVKLLMENYFAKNEPIDIKNKEYRENSLSGLKKAINDLRDISHDLMPKDLDATGLTASLKNQINFIEKANSNLTINFITQGDIDLLTAIVQLNIYRISNELLQNIIKHSKASKVSFQLLLFNKQLQLIMEDDGIGFLKETHTNGIGLQNIITRVNFLNGTYSIDSNALGTTTIIEIEIL